MNNKKALLKRDIAKHKNTQKWKIAAEKRKSKYSQSEKFQNQTTENGEKRDNKKSAQKRDIQKQIKLRGKDNVNTRKIFKRYVYLRKIANL